MSDAERPTTAIRTFLFVDIRGYTRFTEEHGDVEALRLVEKFESLARKSFGAWHGQIIGRAGDELAAVFGSARDAIRSSVQLQTDFTEEATDNPDRPQVGIGLDAGEAVPSGDSYIGTALNLAARLCKLAGPREVLASDSVVHIAGKMNDIIYAERGFTQLKGFQDPVHIFRVVKGRQPAVPARPEEYGVFEGGDSRTLPIGAFLGALPSTVLVSRKKELTRLQDAADEVLAGRSRLILISGEPGVGKTRLAQEAMLSVRNRRFVVATGRCYEQQKSVPFYPFVDILSDLYSSSSVSIRSAIASRWPYLFRLLPDFSTEEIPRVATSPEEQQRLFRAVAGFVQAVSSEHPTAIFLDDLHLADGPSLDLLQHLVRNSRGARLLMVGTYRDVEVPRHHPLEAALRDLMREELVERVHLRRLEEKDTSKLIAATLGNQSVSSDLVGVVQERTEGNPFFTQQLVRFLVERGDFYQAEGKWIQRPSIGVAVPESVRSVIEQRMARLREKTQELLREASVLGQTFQFDTLLALSAQLEVDVEASLEEACAAGLVIETQGDSYAFDHMLTQQALYGELPARRRQRLHLGAAEALGRLPEKTRSLLSSQMAWHFLEADQKERAIPYALSAGDRSTMVFAYNEANKHYTLALDIAQRSGNVPGEVAALTRRARLFSDLFQGKNASRDYERLLEVAQVERNQQLELAARLGLTRAYYIIALDESGGDAFSRCRGMSESAYDLARLLGDKRSMVQALLSRKDYVDFWPEFRAQWRENAKEAMDLSQQVGDSDLIIESELATWIEGSKAESLNRAVKLIDQLKNRNDLFLLNRLYFEMMWMYLNWGDYEKAVEICDSGIHLAREIGVPPVQYPTLKALALLQLGRFGEASESLQAEVVDSEHLLGQAMQTLGYAQYYLELESLDQAVQFSKELQQRARQLHRAWMGRMAIGILARSLARRGELDSASRNGILAEFEGISGGIPHEVMAEIQLAEGKHEAAFNEARTMADEAIARDHGSRLIMAYELEARALLYLGRPGDVIPLLHEGCRIAREHKALGSYWKLLALKGRALRELNDVDGSQKTLQEAAATVRRIGDSISNPRERAEFLGRAPVLSVLEWPK